MTRNAVQNEQIVLPERSSFQEQTDDLSCQGKLLILEKKATLENSMDKVKFYRRVIRDAFTTGNGAAEL